METLKIKTWLPVFPGFYGTIFEPNEELAVEYPYTSDDYEFNYDDYYQDAAKASVDGIQIALKEAGFNCKIVFEQLRSPREYNFANDAIDVTFKITPAFINKIKKYCIDNIGDFDQYLERYTDCSGFISSYSNDSNDWLTYINPESLEDNPHYLGSLLDFVLTNEGYDDMRLESYVSENCWLFGELKKQTEFELNGVNFEGDKNDAELYYPYYWNSDATFFEYCLATLKQIVYTDPKQLSLTL